MATACWAATPRSKGQTCTVIGATGNAIEIAGDNVRRMLRVDVDAEVERPETRAFDFDCEAEARRDRGELVVAALTMLRAHALAGWPAAPDRATLGSFEEWDRFVAGAIVFAGGSDIVALLDKTREADPERDELAEVLHMLEGIGATKDDEDRRDHQRGREEEERDPAKGLRDGRRTERSRPV